MKRSRVGIKHCRASKGAIIEAMASAPSMYAAAMRAGYPANTRNSFTTRSRNFGLRRHAHRDVVIIEDSAARIEILVLKAALHPL